jgi:hypothetical protein
MTPVPGERITSLSCKLSLFGLVVVATRQLKQPKPEVIRWAMFQA